jgi:predicted DNA binding CopG/RHH family protein
LAQVIGEREKVSMKNKIKYTNEPIEARVISDFLPSPENLILREKKTKVTLTLTEKSLSFFKNAAKEHGASYQAMIRRLLDYYVVNQKTQ